MAERLNAAVLKTVDPLRGPWVRIPLSPQATRNRPATAGLFLWRDARVVEWDGLENRCTGNGTEGSNPSLSATIINLKIRKFEDLEMLWSLQPLCLGLQ